MGITETGDKEFLDFLLGGRESQVSWKNLLLRLKKRGLTDKQLSLITVDGNPGLLAALKTCFPDVKVQRCTVHKLRNISNHCPRAIQARIIADVKRIIYATSKREALEEFGAWKRGYQNLAPKAITCLEKDLVETLRFFIFPIGCGSLFVPPISLSGFSESFVAFENIILCLNQGYIIRILLSLKGRITEEPSLGNMDAGFCEEHQRAFYGRIL